MCLERYIELEGFDSEKSEKKQELPKKESTVNTQLEDCPEMFTLSLPG